MESLWWIVSHKAASSNNFNSLPPFSYHGPVLACEVLEGIFVLSWAPRKCLSNKKCSIYVYWLNKTDVEADKRLGPSVLDFYIMSSTLFCSLVLDTCGLCRGWFCYLWSLFSKTCHYFSNIKVLKSGSWRDLCTSIFTTALFTIVKMQKQRECPPTMYGLRKCGVHTQGNISL